MTKSRKTTLRNKRVKRGGDIEDGLPVSKPASEEKTNGLFGLSMPSIKMPSMPFGKKEEKENNDPNIPSMMEKGNASDIPSAQVGGKKRNCGCSGNSLLSGGKKRGRKSRKGVRKSKKSRKTKRRRSIKGGKRSLNLPGINLPGMTGGRKLRKSKKSRKGRKSKKSRKGRKSKKSRKSRKSRK